MTTALSKTRSGKANSAIIGLVVMLVALVVLGCLLVSIQKPATIGGEKLVVFCAAGTRPAMKDIVAQYEDEFDVEINIQYQGSNTLLSQIEAAPTGDIYIAADDSYIDLAIERGLVKETVPIARQRPIIAVQKGNPMNITGIDDLLKPDIYTGVGNPDQAAVGKVTRKLLKASGHWGKLEARVETDGVYKPTVPEVANDVVLGHMHAAIIWDATINNYKDKLEAIRVPELDAGTADITIGVLTSTEVPPRALHFARYVAAPTKGQAILESKGFETTPGDPWAERPKLTFFCGAVNRKAVEPIIRSFEQREAADITISYNGCGVLVGTMKTIAGQETGSGFPDTYMACDTYYLDVVQDWFEPGVNVSDTNVVLVVQKGNPKNIRTLADLTKPDIRIATGQPQQCTIGVLTRRLFEAENIADEVKGNIVTEMTSSSLLIPQVTEGAVDVVLAYETDTRAAADRIDVIPIDSKVAVAVQPFTIARTSENRQLARRLFNAIAASKSDFEAAGFHWRLDARSGNEKQPESAE